uniref:Uncharacterized protein n=1 Tax=Cucumis melo TaxID=3656 RepID=A0A1S3CSG8_CUCME
MESHNPIFVFFLFIILPLLSLNLPSNFAAHYIPSSLLSPPPMPSITRPIVPYHPFIFPPPFKKAFRRHTWLPPPLPPQQKLERPIVPYYPYKFPPPPSRKQANPPLSYHAFPPPTLPLPAKKLYMSE